MTFWANEEAETAKNRAAKNSTFFMVTLVN